MPNPQMVQYLNLKLKVIQQHHLKLHLSEILEGKTLSKIDYFLKQLLLKQNKTFISKYLLNTVSDSLGNAVQYSYDAHRRLSGIESDGSWVSYGYDTNGRISEISKNNSAGTEAALTYKMEYDVCFYCNLIGVCRLYSKNYCENNLWMS